MSTKKSNKTRKAPASASANGSPPRAGRRFVFEFEEIKDNRTMKPVSISVKADTEKEAWQALHNELQKHKEQLRYTGRFYIEHR